MRFLDRLGMVLLGLVVSVPGTVRADEPGTASTVPNSPAQSARPPKHHVGLFRRCMCVDCQRARVKAHDGVEVPLPPPVPSHVVTAGSAPAAFNGSAMQRRGLFASKEECKVCEEGGTVISGPGMMVNGNEAPGHAVIGGTIPMAEPSPIGVVQGQYLKKGRSSTASRSGKVDPSVAQTQLASPSPVPGTDHNRPHIIEHMFGLDAIGKRSTAAMDRRERERHASISYGAKNAEPVTDLPAAMVYKAAAR